MFPSIRIHFIEEPVQSYFFLHVVGYLCFLVVGWVLLRDRKAKLPIRPWLGLALLLVVSDTVLAHLASAVLNGGPGVVTTVAAWRGDRGPYWGSPAIFFALAGLYLLLRGPGSLLLLDVTCIAWSAAGVWLKFACFARGCCNGAMCTFAWATYFDGRHPTALYEMVAQAATCLILIWLYAADAMRGRLILWLGVGYGLSRFLLETLRGDIVHGVAGTQVSLSQLLALGAAAFCTVVLLAGQKTDVGVARPSSETATPLTSERG